MQNSVEYFEYTKKYIGNDTDGILFNVKVIYFEYLIFNLFPL